MRNLLLIFRRYFTFISFLVLQIICIYFLVKYNKFHRAAFLGVANEITGRFNSQYDNIDDYFHLKEENKRVHKLNDSLLNLLNMNFVDRDTTARLVTDTLRTDTSTRIRRYYWREAKVVANSVNSRMNYLQINKGANQGIRDYQAVVNSNGSIVGVVINVSPNFSQVMSLLHVERSTSVMMKQSQNTGSLEWGGRDPEHLLLRRIPKSDSVRVGDTVLTSNFDELTFPPGLMVGTVSKIENEKSTGDYLLEVKPKANFQNLQQVFVIENLFREEQKELEAATRKKVEDKKN